MTDLDLLSSYKQRIDGAGLSRDVPVVTTRGFDTKRAAALLRLHRFGFVRWELRNGVSTLVVTQKGWRT